MQAKMFQFLFYVAEVETQCYDAFSYGREEEALRLLKQVEDPRKVKNKNNFTLLHCAAHYGWLDIVKVLITGHQYNPECEDKDGNTPLSKARSNGKQHVVDYLEKIIGTFVVYLCLCTYSIIMLFLVFNIICVNHSTSSKAIITTRIFGLAVSMRYK